MRRERNLIDQRYGRHRNGIVSRVAVAHPDYYQVIFGAETIKAEHPRAASLAISGDLAHVGIDEDPETLTTFAVTDALK